MSKPVALAIIHGTGEKEPDFADDIIDVLHERFPEHLPEALRDEAELVIEPIYWAHIPRKKEDEVWAKVESAGPMEHKDLRRFIFNLAGDALAYQPSEGREDLYIGVHREIADGFARLAERASGTAPLCLAAHSMGTIVAHNYLFDIQHEPEHGLEGENELPRPETPLERGATLALFCTYGSPIAIWRLRYGDDYKAIRFPGEDVHERYPYLQPKWLNIYDPNDVLGYPIHRLTERYRELADDGYLEDREQNVGSWLKSWNPAAHKGYFRDESCLDDLAGHLATVWQGAYHQS